MYRTEHRATGWTTIILVLEAAIICPILYIHYKTIEVDPDVAEVEVDVHKVDENINESDNYVAG